MLTDEQLEMRRTGVGGSEVAIVAGLSPYGSILDVWRSKMGEETFTGNAATRRGQLLEPAVAAWYAEETGAELREVGTVRHPTSPIALATPDRIAKLNGRERLLEIKTANLRQLDKWGEGDDEVPMQYLAQVQWTMACVGLHYADLAVLIAGDEFRVYHLQRDLEIESMLLEAADAFWRKYVVPRTPPPIDGSESCAKWLEERFTARKGHVLVADVEAEQLSVMLRAARANKALAEAAEGEARNRLIAKMLAGEAEGIAGDGWKLSYRQTKGAAKTDWEAVAEAAGVPDSLIQAHTTIAAGYRRFLPTFPKENK